MLLMSGGKISAIIAAARDASHEEVTFLPNITKGNNHQRSKTMPARDFRGTDHVREALESKSGLPTDMTMIRYCGKSAPTKAVRFGTLPADEGEEVLLQQIEDAAQPSAYEKDLPDDEKEIIERIRSEVRLFKPDKALILTSLRDLVYMQRSTFLEQRAQTDELQSTLDKTITRAAETKQELDAIISQLEEQLQGKDQELADGAARQRELEMQLAALEAQFKLAASAGLTAEEAAKTAAQLAKSRASVEALKLQVEELRAAAIEAETARRQELQAARDKHRKAQEELKALSENYGPENFARISAQLQETLTEMAAARDRLRRAKLAQEQQHKLVVEWRIRVDEADARTREAAEAAADREAEIARLEARGADLEAQVQMREQDARKLREQNEALVGRLQEYVDKYSRQAAHLKAQEAVWKAIAVKNAALELANDHGA